MESLSFLRLICPVWFDDLQTGSLIGLGVLGGTYSGGTPDGDLSNRWDGILQETIDKVTRVFILDDDTELRGDTDWEQENLGGFSTATNYHFESDTGMDHFDLSRNSLLHSNVLPASNLEAYNNAIEGTYSPNTTSTNWNKELAHEVLDFLFNENPVTYGD